MDIQAIAFDLNGTLIQHPDRGRSRRHLPRDRAPAHLPGHRPAPPPGARSLLPDPEATTRREPREVPGVRRGRGLAHHRRCARERLHPRACRPRSWPSCRCCWPRCTGECRAAASGSSRTYARCSTGCARTSGWRSSPTGRAAGPAANCTRSGSRDYFDPIVISGDHGFRKPDRRLFQYALDGLGVAAENTMYVGNDMHRDIYGAREAGLTTVMFDSDQGTKEYEGSVPDLPHHRPPRPVADLGRLTPSQHRKRPRSAPAQSVARLRPAQSR